MAVNSSVFLMNSFLQDGHAKLQAASKVNLTFLGPLTFNSVLSKNTLSIIGLSLGFLFNLTNVLKCGQLVVEQYLNVPSTIDCLTFFASSLSQPSSKFNGTSNHCLQQKYCSFPLCMVTLSKGIVQIYFFKSIKLIF